MQSKVTPRLPVSWVGPRYYACIVLTLFLAIGCAANRPTFPVYQTSTSKDTWDRYQPVSLNELKRTLFDFPEGHVGMTVNAAAAVKT